MFQIRKINGFVLVLCGIFALSSAALGDPVAMITDLSGNASKAGVGLEILAELEVGSTVTVAEGAGLSIVYYHDGNEYKYSGPAEFQVGETSPKTLSGEQPVADSLLPDGSGSVSTVGLAQAAMVMRGSPNDPKLTLVYPVETTLLSSPEDFQWQALETGVGYSFELTDYEGRSMIETTVNGTTLEVPEHLKLTPGEYYTWSLETRLPDGRKFSNWASFSVADSELLASVAKRRPDDGSNVSRLVLFALWLEQNELIDEARKYWGKINSMRPGGKNIQARLGGQES